jgi:hypothetical protein
MPHTWASCSQVGFAVGVSEPMLCDPLLWPLTDIMGYQMLVATHV